MENTFDILRDDCKTTSELLENVVIEKTSPRDYYDFIEIIAKTFEVQGNDNVSHHIFTLIKEELTQTKADFNESIKLIDKRDGEIYGLLVLSHYPIQIGSPIMTKENTRMIGEYLMGRTQINGFAFVIDKRLRGYGFDKKMIEFAMPFIEQFEYMWVATSINFKAPNYYKKLGLFEIYRDRNAIFYIADTKKRDMVDIFILKALAESKEDEKDYNFKE